MCCKQVPYDACQHISVPVLDIPSVPAGMLLPHETDMGVEWGDALGLRESRSVIMYKHLSVKLTRRSAACSVLRQHGIGKGAAMGGK